MSIFIGPSSENQAHIWQVFNNTIKAQFIRFYPQTWNVHMSMRAAVLDGKENILNPPESARTYSSHWSNGGPYDHTLSMLNSRQAWSSGVNRVGEWMTINLGNPQEVRGVVTQGRARDCCADQFVRTFKIGHSMDGQNFTMLDDTASANTNSQVVPLARGIRYILITPPTSYIQISQIAVYAAGNPHENIAKGKPVTVTSTYPGTRAESVVDGTLANKPHPGGWHSLTGNSNEYFLLDLQKPYPIDKVVYYNRGDCCQNRAKGMLIRLQDENRNEIWTGTLTSAMVQTLNFKSSVEDPYRFLPLEEKCRGYASKMNVGDTFEKNYFKTAIAETCMPYYSNEFVKCTTETTKALKEIDSTIKRCAGPLYTCQSAFNINTQMIIRSAKYGVQSGNTMDVRQRIENLRAQGVKSIVISNVTFGGDPAPGIVKNLRLVLKSSYDAKFVKIIPEGQTLNLDFDNEADMAPEEKPVRKPPSYTFSTLGRNQNGGDESRPSGESRQKGGYAPYNAEPITHGGGSVNLVQKIEDYFVPPEAKLIDNNRNCKAWADKNPSECDLNPTFMLAQCAKSCAADSAAPITRDLKRANKQRRYNVKYHKDFEEFNKHYKLFSSCPTKDYVKKADVQHIYDKTLSLVEKLHALKNNFSADIRTHPDYRLLLDKYALKNAKGDYIDCIPCKQ